MVAALKQPSGSTLNTTTHPDYSDAERMEMLRRLCAVLGMTPERFMYLMKCAEKAESLEQQCSALKSELHALKGNCKCDTFKSELEQRCDNIWAAARRACCPGNILFSQITLDEFSDDKHVVIDQIVQNFGPGFVNTFPVPPGSSIRLEQVARPGYLPDEISIDAGLANNGSNYLDLKIKFFLGPGGTNQGKQIGPVWSGNEFLNKDGTQIHVSMPKYRGKIVEVGSVERMAVEISVGGPNNLESVNIRLPYDEEKWYKYCASPGTTC